MSWTFAFDGFQKVTIPWVPVPRIEFDRSSAYAVGQHFCGACRRAAYNSDRFDVISLGQLRHKFHTVFLRVVGFDSSTRKPINSFRVIAELNYRDSSARDGF